MDALPTLSRLLVLNPRCQMLDFLGSPCSEQGSRNLSMVPWESLALSGYRLCYACTDVGLNSSPQRSEDTPLPPLHFYKGSSDT